MVDDLVLGIEYEQAAPKLLERCLRGQVIPKLEIELTATIGGARETYLGYVMKNVLVTSYRVHASGDDESSRPTVTVSVSFEEIKVTYTEMDASGAVETKHAREKGSARKQTAAPATVPKMGTSKKGKKAAARRKSS